MCGLVGYFSFSEKLEKFVPEKLKIASSLIKSRGPDEETFFCDESAHFAFRRLSIQDIQKGSQPIKSKCGRYLVFLNGEIYNHIELRKEFLNMFSFRTNSDAETLVELISKYGLERSLNMLNGMFAFSCYDLNEKIIFLCRDRFGVKPLFYKYDSRNLIFSSELTPIIFLSPDSDLIDYQSLYRFLVFWYVCEPDTIYKKIKSLTPGHFLAINSTGKISLHEWWKPNLNKKAESKKEFINNLNYLIKDSVNLRLLSDVPITSLLSGGIDSGIVTYFWSQISSEANKESFTLGFEEKSYDESSLARKQADRCNISLKDSILKTPSFEDLNFLYSRIDQPLGNSSFVGSMRLFESVSKNSYKVCLTGDGADEIFGGYPTYQMYNLSRFWDQMPRFFQKKFSSIFKNIPVSFSLISFDYKIKQFLKSTEFEPHHPFYRSIFTPDLAKIVCPSCNDISYEYLIKPFKVSLEKSAGRNFSRENANLHLDFDTFLLNDHLPKIDRSSMAYGVEARNPYLDYRIYEFAYSNPHYYKYSLFSLKKSLKKIGNNILHKDILSSKKKGLTLPIANWINSDLGVELENNILSSDFAKNIFNCDYINQLFNDHRSMVKDNSREIWAINSLILWADSHSIKF